MSAALISEASPRKISRPSTRTPFSGLRRPLGSCWPRFISCSRISPPSAWNAAAPSTRRADSSSKRYLSAGLAEFRYRQGLDPTRRIVFTANDGTASAEPPSIIPTLDKILLLNGGGRDTAVMAELAKTTGLPLGWCSINGGERHQLLERASHISESYPLRFRVDPAIRQDGRYKWGHTPFAAVYMAVSLLVAVARRFRYVAIGNEYSASIGNVRYRGVELNHQYSKSYRVPRPHSRRTCTPALPEVSGTSACCGPSMILGLPPW